MTMVKQYQNPLDLWNFLIYEQNTQLCIGDSYHARGKFLSFIQPIP